MNEDEEMRQWARDNWMNLISRCADGEISLEQLRIIHEYIMDEVEMPEVI